MNTLASWDGLDDAWLAVSRNASKHGIHLAPASLVDWRARITDAPADGPIHGLCLWFPADEHQAVRLLPFADLALSLELHQVYRSSTNRELVIVLRDAEMPGLILRLDTRSAHALIETLELPLLPWGAVFAPIRPARLWSELDGHRQGHRQLTLAFEDQTDEPLLSGPALRLATGLPHPDSTTGVELLLPLADGSAGRLLTRLEWLLKVELPTRTKSVLAA
jgi:hypothetical protein